MRRRVASDILETKRAELASYQSKFDSTVSVVTGAVDDLTRINENIEAKIKEIEEYKAELESTQNGLSAARDRNSKVIKNFNALLGIE